ncbi:MAG: hypothetical protein QXM27_01950 [Candidatus Pacearchaeota archaeon]
MIKKILILFFIAILFFGCKQEKKETFYGLRVNFVDNAPPSNISIGQRFPIIVDVENFGEWKIPSNKAVFYLSGVGKNLKDYSNRVTNNIEIQERKDNITAKHRVVFANSAYSDLSIQNPFKFNLVLDYCYDYTTITDVTICVAKQTSNICKIEGNKIDSKSNTNGPIQITSLTQQVVGNNLIIEFVISNLGKGKTYSPDITCDDIENKLSQALIKENYVKININDNGLGFKCMLLDKDFTTKQGLDGYANLGKIRCEKQITDENFPSLIRITTEYKYFDSIVKQLTIYP